MSQSKKNFATFKFLHLPRISLMWRGKQFKDRYNQNFSHMYLKRNHCNVVGQSIGRINSWKCSYVGTHPFIYLLYEANQFPSFGVQSWLHVMRLYPISPLQKMQVEVENKPLVQMCGATWPLHLEDQFSEIIFLESERRI